MVTFVCDDCQTTLKKQKVATHYCGGSSFSCVDCGVNFNQNGVKGHTSCVSEAEKYQGHLYKGPKHAASTTPSKQSNNKDKTQNTSNGGKKDETSKKRKFEETKEEEAATADVDEQEADSKTAESELTTTIRSVVSKAGGAVTVKKLLKKMAKKNPKNTAEQVMAELTKIGGEVTVSISAQ